MRNSSIIQEHLGRFEFGESEWLFRENSKKTNIEYTEVKGCSVRKFTNEFWTSKQRQADSLHEISYRACFKPQLPRFFMELLTEERDVVYDPFSGRGTTCIEAGLLNRNVIANDINPLSKILSKPRFFIPDIKALKKRLYSISFAEKADNSIDLSMFYHPETEAEILSLRKYLEQKKRSGEEDDLDNWIRMIATNRLTGHSSGFFSVYTLPPNQAVSPESQKKINEKRRQAPEYRNIREIILRKSESLLKDVSAKKIIQLHTIGENALFLTRDARYTPEITSEYVQLTVTSPPFLDVVQYDDDNWLRCWFNSIDAKDISSKMAMTKRVKDWCDVMNGVFQELYRITKPGGYVAFEVGEVKGGEVKLEEYVMPLGLKFGFDCEGIMINQQEFTKTANIWGISNNKKGTNTNRIVIFRKP